MKLVLYSGGDGPAQDFIYAQTASLISSHRTLSYIASDTRNQDEADEYFASFANTYRRFGVTKIRRYAPDRADSLDALEEAWGAAAVYLAGGPTFHFLYHLRRLGAVERLRQYVIGGGLIIGASAGAMILSPTIATAGLAVVGDKNEPKLDRLESMGVFPYQFVPHYRERAVDRDEVMAYSSSVGSPIIACPDSSGVFVDGVVMRFVGDVRLFHPTENTIQT